MSMIILSSTNRNNPGHFPLISSPILRSINRFSSLTTMFQTTTNICQNVNLTDDLKISLEYDIQHGLLNIFVKDTGNQLGLPSQINILSNQSQDSLHSSVIQQDFSDEINDLSSREDDDDDDEPKICIELSNIYVYDLDDDDENDLYQTMITSPPLLFSSSSFTSSCFDEQIIDNDDGYSTHSFDDIDHHHHQQQQQQQQSISIPPSKLIIPFVPYQHEFYFEEYVSSIHRLIEHVLWLNPFKKTVKQMLRNHFLD